MRVINLGAARIAVILMLILSRSVSATGTDGTKMNFHGTLVDEPCTISPADTDIKLDFGTINDKDLYANNRTNSMPFVIHLEDCNIDGLPDGANVVVHFEGAEDTKMNQSGYLSMSDTTIGAAIGIEEEDGTFLGLHKNSAPVKLVDGSITLNFKAFVEGEPIALSSKTIKLGDFSATSTFILDYP
jgi:type 1 fimbria pilin